jgi:hypothetical protein
MLKRRVSVTLQDFRAGSSAKSAFCRFHRQGRRAKLAGRVFHGEAHTPITRTPPLALSALHPPRLLPPQFRRLMTRPPTVRPLSIAGSPVSTMLVCRIEGTVPSRGTSGRQHRHKKEGTYWKL